MKSENEIKQIFDVVNDVLNERINGCEKLIDENKDNSERLEILRTEILYVFWAQDLVWDIRSTIFDD